ncbi:sensor histidine kinase [Aquimarina macrocephali]|uniref:sensor histidine kinase n=1 Tax=Aquimarina macrocephali TaxID=666563 RepID=UPI0004672ED8|nr:GAF domain-containing sensor histidine kinase [Aquimarina macrocephali]
MIKKNTNRIIDNEEQIRINAYKILKEKSSCHTLYSKSEIESDYVINTIAKSILGKTNYYDIAWEVVVNISYYLKCEDCVIYLIKEDGKSIEQLAAFGNKVNDKKIINQLVIPIGEGIVGTVAMTGIPELIHDTSKDERYIEDIEFNYSEIVVPIVVNGQVIGIIDSEHKEKNYYTYDNLLTLMNISRVIAKQLNNAVRLEKKIETERIYKQLNSQLKNKNKSLEEYAHIVSHDLKSPLRNISTLIEWVKEDNINKLDKTTLGNIQQIGLSLEHMEQLINDVLEYSSIEQNITKRSLINIDKLLNNIIEVINVPKNIIIKIEKMPNRLYADKTKIKQVFQNLITNAIKYNDKEVGCITINYTELENEHQFTIADNGIGIDKRYFNKIFNAFQSLKKTQKSTGIGLSIVKKVIKILKGKIWLESEIGKGTTFYFTISK